VSSDPPDPSREADEASPRVLGDFAQKVAENRNITGGEIAHIAEAFGSLLTPWGLPRFRFVAGSSAASACLVQHPVGQGFFHSGSIAMPDTPTFRYVYDCGKLHAKPGEWPHRITEMLKTHGRGPLGALFISHLDDDHVNGVAALLGMAGGADTAFLPYFDPATRALQAGRQAERGVTLDPSYIRFLADPTRWLHEHEVRRVVYVYGGLADERGGPLPPSDMPRPEEPMSGPSVQIGPPPADVAVSPGDLSPSLRQVDGFMNQRSPIVVHGAHGREPVWMFQAFVHPDEEARQRVHDIVKASLGTSTFDALMEGGTACALVLKDHIKRLQRAYRDALHGAPRRTRKRRMSGAARGIATDNSPMNRSTMSVFSGPVEAGTWRQGIAWPRLPIPEPIVLRLIPSGVGDGWLLTGDATLLDAEVLKNFVAFFSTSRGTPNASALSRTLVLTIPHHGSSKNFDARVDAALSTPPIVVLPAGNKEHFGHPEESVLRLLSGRRIVAHVHAGQPAFVHVLHRSSR
jgi:hypothetical protein